MNSSTVELIRGVLKTDATLSPEKRAAILRAMQKTPQAEGSLGKRLLTRTEAANFLSVSGTSIWRLVKAGRLKPVKIGERSLRYKITELEEMIQ